MTAVIPELDVDEDVFIVWEKSRRSSFGPVPVSTGLNEACGGKPRMTAASLISGHFSNANSDIAGAPLGFGNVLFSVEEKAPAFFAPLQVAPQAEAFLA